MTRSWHVALALSLALHAGVLFALVRTPKRVSGAGTKRAPAQAVFRVGLASRTEPAAKAVEVSVQQATPVPTTPAIEPLSKDGERPEVPDAPPSQSQPTASSTPAATETPSARVGANAATGEGDRGDDDGADEGNATDFGDSAFERADYAVHEDGLSQPPTDLDDGVAREIHRLLHLAASHCYPETLRRFRQSGQVEVRFTVSASLKAEEVTILSTTHPMFATAVEGCLFQAVDAFPPQAEGYSLQLPVRFSIEP